MRWRGLVHHQFPGAGPLTEVLHTIDLQNLRVLITLARKSSFQRLAEGEEPFSPNEGGPRGDAATGIPRVIYQTWKSHSLPANYAFWRESFRRLNPDFHMLMWEDAENRRFVQECFPGVLGLYDSFPREIFRVDLVRPLFLLQRGGYYFDLDCEAVHPIDERWSATAVLLGRMGDHAAFSHSLPNATMGSMPGQMFWLVYAGFIIDAAESRSRDELELLGPEAITGPIALWTTYQQWRAMTRKERAVRALEVADRLGATDLPVLSNGDVHIAPKREMFALDWNNRVHQRLIRHMRDHELVLTPSAARRLFPGAISTTYWSHSWGYTREGLGAATGVQDEGPVDA